MPSSASCPWRATFLEGALSKAGLPSVKGRSTAVPRLPVKRQAELPGISPGAVHHPPAPIPNAELALMRRVDRLHLDHPHAGSRMLRDLLRLQGVEVGRRHVATLMRRMGIQALHRKPDTIRHGVFRQAQPALTSLDSPRNPGTRIDEAFSAGAKVKTTVDPMTAQVDEVAARLVA